VTRYFKRFGIKSLKIVEIICPNPKLPKLLLFFNHTPLHPPPSLRKNIAILLSDKWFLFLIRWISSRVILVLAVVCLCLLLVVERRLTNTGSSSTPNGLHPKCCCCCCRILP